MYSTLLLTPFAEAMERYQRARDASALPTFELTCGFATLQPPPPHMQALFAVLERDQAAADDFVSAMAGTLPVPDFFAPENLARLVEGASPETAAAAR